MGIDLMITTNGYRFGVCVFAICVTMLVAGQLSAGLTERGSDSTGEAAGPDARPLHSSLD